MVLHISIIFVRFGVFMLTSLLAAPFSLLHRCIFSVFLAGSTTITLDALRVLLRRRTLRWDALAPDPVVAAFLHFANARAAPPSIVVSLLRTLLYG